MKNKTINNQKKNKHKLEWEHQVQKKKIKTAL